MTAFEILTRLGGPVGLVLHALAVYRLTRLLTRDSLPPIARARDRVIARWNASPWSELAVCDWCMSVWVATLWTATALLLPTIALLAAVPLALAATAGFMASKEG